MFVAFSFMLFIWYLQKSQGIDFLENDMNTITASDFTVEMDITRDMWQHYLEQYYEPKGKNMKEEGGENFSQALYLKKYLTDEIGRIMTDARKHRLEYIKTSNAEGLKKSSGLTKLT